MTILVECLWFHRSIGECVHWDLFGEIVTTLRYPEGVWSTHLLEQRVHLNSMVQSMLKIRLLI